MESEWDVNLRQKELTRICMFISLQKMSCGYFMDPGKINGQMSATPVIKQVVKQGFVKDLDFADFSDGNERKNGVDEQNKVTTFHVKKPFNFAVVSIHWCIKKNQSCDSKSRECQKEDRSFQVGQGSQHLEGQSNTMCPIERRAGLGHEVAEGEGSL